MALSILAMGGEGIGPEVLDAALKVLDVAAASKAIDDHVGSKLGLSTEEAAEAILRVANSRMADVAASSASTRRRERPRRMTRSNRHLRR